jgi:hypothetical protein
MNEICRKDMGILKEMNRSLGNEEINKSNKKLS